MKVFLSSRYSRRDELRGYRDLLQSLGHTIISRWLDTDWEMSDEDRASAAPDNRRVEYAVIDLVDVSECKLLIAFTDPPESRGRRGGRHVELGYAMGQGLACMVIGPPEHIFHFHPAITACSLIEFADGLALISRHKNVPKNQLVPWLRLFGGEATSL